MKFCQHQSIIALKTMMLHLSYRHSISLNFLKLIKSLNVQTCDQSTLSSEILYFKYEIKSLKDKINIQQKSINTQSDEIEKLKEFKEKSTPSNHLFIATELDFNEIL